MNDTFEIYFKDLTLEKQKEYLEFQGVENSDELNAEVVPLAILEFSDWEGIE